MQGRKAVTEDKGVDLMEIHIDNLEQKIQGALVALRSARHLQSGLDYEHIIAVAIAVLEDK
jgi:hypothetical protein